MKVGQYTLLVPPESFKDLLSGSIAEGLRRSSTRLYAMGRGVWVPEEGDRRLSAPGLALPSRLRGKRSSSALIDFIETFVVLTDYLEPSVNRGSCLHDIQSTRRERNLRVRSTRAFDSFAVDREHWYTYNTGRRSEAQFNIGLFPEYLRIGLGFEFTKNMHGEPKTAQAMYKQFVDILGRYWKGFDRFVDENSLKIEWRPGRSRLQYVPTENVSSWLLDNSEDAEWIFVGRLLYRGNDARILDDPSYLKQTMEAVFKSFKPLWQQVQIEAEI